MFNMKALLDHKLTIRTSSVNNLKARHSTFIFTILRTVEILENVGTPVPKKVLLNTSVKRFNGFTILYIVPQSINKKRRDCV